MLQKDPNYDFLYFLPSTFRLLCNEINHDPSFNLEFRGPVVMKGKKEPMNCWFLSRRLTQLTTSDPAPIDPAITQQPLESGPIVTA
jgi:hypothetical protein